jgi:ubiquinone/menaquinone biosynthesis C-methylase UbiE
MRENSMSDNRIYNPQEHWDNVGKTSVPGSGEDSGLFGTDDLGNSLYQLPKWSTPPQYWEYMESGAYVLDIGSGNGLQVGRLSQHGVFAIGCDISLELLKVAKSNIVSHGISAPGLVQWDGFKMPFASDAFDRITTNTVLQHVIDESAIDSIFSETSRVLKNKGLFLICELVSQQDMQTAPHVKLRSTQAYTNRAIRYGMRVKKIRHRASTYVAIQSVYGKFLLRTSAAVSHKNSSNVKQHYHSQNSWSVVFFVKQVARQLISGFAKIVDQLAIILHLDEKLPGQDEIVFEKYRS